MSSAPVEEGRGGVANVVGNVKERAVGLQRRAFSGVDGAVDAMVVMGIYRLFKEAGERKSRRSGGTTTNALAHTAQPHAVGGLPNRTNWSWMADRLSGVCSGSCRPEGHYRAT